MLFTCFSALLNLFMHFSTAKGAPTWFFVIYMIPMFYALFILFQNPIRAIKISLLSPFLLLFCLWILASTLWSNIPFTTIKQGILYFITYLTSLALCVRYTAKELGFILVVSYFLFAVSSLFMVIFLPQYGIMTEIYPGAWSGLWGFKQGLGVAMAFGISIVSSYGVINKESRTFASLVILLMLLLIYKSEATTAVLAGVVSLAIAIIFLISYYSPSYAVFSFWVSVTIGSIVLAALTVFKTEFFALIGKSPDLTGRKDIWNALNAPIQSRWLLGWGYYAFWTDESNTSQVNRLEDILQGFRPPDAHSSPIDIRLQTGIVGLTIAIMAFAQSILAIIIGLFKTKNSLMLLCFMIIFLMICFTEALALAPMDFITLTVHMTILRSTLNLLED